MVKSILVATHNKGKQNEISKLLQPLDLEIVLLDNLNISDSIIEDGKTIEENAIKKAQGYASLIKNTIVLADDTGLEIDVLNGQPGLNVRTWNGRRMSDQEIIDYCLNVLKGITQQKRTAIFKTVLALCVPNKEIVVFEGVLKGRILEKETGNIKREGFPFDTLFYVDIWKMTLGEIHSLSNVKKNAKQIITHREKALLKLANYLQYQTK